MERFHLSDLTENVQKMYYDVVRSRENGRWRLESQILCSFSNTRT